MLRWNHSTAAYFSGGFRARRRLLHTLIGYTDRLTELQLERVLGMSVLIEGEAGPRF